MPLAASSRPSVPTARGGAVDARPSPRLARTLSRVVPGLGQWYGGAFLTGAVFAGAAVFLVLAMLQAWDEWKRSWLFVVIGPLVAGLFGLNAWLSGRLAERRAERMDRHAPVWRCFLWWWRSGTAFDSAAELVLLAAFALAAGGVLLGWPFAQGIADYLRYWPVFELLGGFSVGFYAGFIGNLEERIHPTRLSNRRVVQGMLLFQCAAAAALCLLFRLPLGMLAAALALTLPGHVRTLIVIGGEHREEATLRAGAILISLTMSFVATGLISEELVRPLVDGLKYAAFPSMLMGALYTTLRITLDAAVRKMKQTPTTPCAHP